MTNEMIEKRLKDEGIVIRINDVEDYVRIKSIITTIQSLIRESMPSREQVEAILWKEHPSTWNWRSRRLDDLMQLFESEREWCEHMVWGGKNTTSGSWGLKGIDPGSPRVTSYAMEKKWYEFCPVCGKPRPEDS